MRMTIRNLPENTLYYVQLRTKSGENYSQYSQRFELRTAKDEIAPGPVINPSANFNDGNLTMAWEPPVQNADGTPLYDLKDYKVTIGPIPADGNWPLFTMYVEGNRADFTKEMNIAAFGTFRANLVIHIQARDIVDNLSTFTPIEKIKQKPKPPVITSWASSGSSFSGSWTPPSQDVTNLALTDLAGYEVTVVYITNPGPSQILNKKVYNTTTPKFDYTYEQNRTDFGGVPGTAKSPLTLEVRARDSVGQLSDPATATAGNAIPAKVTGVTATAGPDSVVVKWTPTADTDLVAYQIYVADTSTGTGTLYGRVSAAHREYIHQTVAYGQPHHVYVTAVDEFLQEGPASDRPASVTPVSPFTVDTEAPPPTTVTAAAPTGRAITLPSAINVTWPWTTANATAAPDLAGFHIRFSENVTPRVWDFVDVFDKDARSFLVTGLRSSTPYVFQIRSYDTMINPSGWSVETTAVTSTASEVVVNNVSNSITIQTGGNIKSSDYTIGGTLGWSLSTSTLDIQQGTVNARVVKAGELRSNVNVAAGLPDAGQPLWSLNLDGNLTVRNALVKGKVVVGDATGGTNQDLAIASATYGIGTTNQWAIRGDGTFEIRSRPSPGATQTLVLDSAGLRASNGTTVTTDINTNGTFSFTTGGGSTGVKFDANGIRLYSGATNVVDLNANGNATFTGTVTASYGAIGGWDINPTTLSKNGLTLNSSTGAITSGSTTTTVGMRAGYGFWAGSTNQWDAGVPFSVDTTGYLTSKKGYIGGWTINSTSLSGAGTISGGVISGTELRGSKYMSAASGYRMEAGNTVLGRGIAWTDDASTSWGYIKLEATYEYVGRLGQNGTYRRLRLKGADGVFIDESSLDVAYSIYSGSNMRSSGDVRGATGVYDSGYRVYSAVNPPPTTEIRRGQSVPTLDSDGYANISHGMGFIPASVVCSGVDPSTGGYIPATIIVTDMTSTTFRIRVLSQSGTAISSLAVRLNWIAVG